MGEYIYRAPILIELENFSVEETISTLKGLTINAVVMKSYFKNRFSAELKNVCHEARREIGTVYGKEVVEMEFPVVTIVGICEAEFVFTGDRLVGTKYDRVKNYSLTTDEVWNMPLMIGNLNENHNITLRHLKDEELARFIHDEIIKIFVDKNL